jgi:hypothetical protein
MDAIEQRDRFIRLVGLKLADEVEFDAGMGFAQGRPLGGRFLHPVFPEHALTGGNQRFDRRSLVRFTDRDQSDILGPALRDLRGVGDAGVDVLQGSGWIDHGALL